MEDFYSDTQTSFESLFSVGTSNSLSSSIELVHSLSRAFENPSILLIQNRAYEFIKTVDLSISIAQAGFKVCDDVINLFSPFHSINQQSRQRRLREMHQWARQGKEDTTQIYNKFIDLSISVGQLLRDVRRISRSSADQGQLKELEKSELKLKLFLGWIKTHTTWLNHIKHEYASLDSLHGYLDDMYSEPSHHHVLLLWRDLRLDYVGYSIFAQNQKSLFGDRDRNRKQFGDCWIDSINGIESLVTVADRLINDI